MGDIGVDVRVSVMRLERIEINGFKSFSDRSELAFDKGVTAIVGPNGCGKSNVADAITWVMGEQSAKSLRGERMEDVIFSGSDARKPTAAAEVLLRFSGVLRNVTGPAFPDDNGHHGNGHQGNARLKPSRDVARSLQASEDATWLAGKRPGKTTDSRPTFRLRERKRRPRGQTVVSLTRPSYRGKSNL